MKCKIIDILKNRFDTIKCYVKKHIPKRCRYFLVTYVYLEGVGFGFSSISLTTNNRYVVSSVLTKAIVTKFPKQFDITVINITKLNKKEYEAFNS